MEKKKRAVLILFLSNYKNSMESEYDYYNTVYKGIQTNDAPYKVLSYEAYKSGTPIDQIIVIGSKNVSFYPVNGDQSAYEIFCSMVIRYCQEQGWKIPEFSLIPYDYRVKDKSEISNIKEISEKDTSEISNKKEIMKNVYLELVKALKINPEEQISAYIDYTGGFRDVAFLMITIIRYLEFANIDCPRIVYSEYPSRKIFELRYIYDMYGLIEGVDEFLNTGRADTLGQVYKDDPTSSIRQVISAIKQFSDWISLCYIDNIEKAVYDLSNALDAFDESNNENDDLFASLFRTLIPTIREKMNLTEDKGMLQDNKVNYPVLIKWCVEHRLIQQALTIYTEKMPAYYLKNVSAIHQILRDINDKEKDAQENINPEKEFWTTLYNRISGGLKIDFFKNDLIDIKRNFDKNNNKDKVKECNRKILKWFDDYLKKKTSRFPKEMQALKKDLQSRGNVSLYNDEWEKQFIKIDEKKVKNYQQSLNNLLNKSDLYCHYYCYDDQKAYEAIPKKNKEDGNNNYRRKVYALMKLKGIAKDASKKEKQEIQELEGKEELLHIMKYYLYVKMIRNRMNHAVSSWGKDDEEAQHWLSEKFDLDMSIKSEVIGKNLLDGISVSIQ